MIGVSKSQNFYPSTNDAQFLWAGLMSSFKTAFRKAKENNFPVAKIFIFLKTGEKNFQVRSIKLNRIVSSPLLAENDLKQAFERTYNPKLSYLSTACHLTN